MLELNARNVKVANGIEFIFVYVVWFREASPHHFRPKTRRLHKLRKDHLNGSIFMLRMHQPDLAKYTHTHSRCIIILFGYCVYVFDLILKMLVD